VLLAAQCVSPVMVPQANRIFTGTPEVKAACRSRVLRQFDMHDVLPGDGLGHIVANLPRAQLYVGLGAHLPAAFQRP
jgi:hypothetical protein